jgi:predicted alpha/beta-fold hydrolase
MDFKAFPILKGSWANTIGAKLLTSHAGPKGSAYHYLELSDGDKLVVAENHLPETKADAPIAVLVHGLAGCYQSFYMNRLTKRFLSQGYRVFRVNLRGCGPGLGHAEKLYHAGRSKDVLEAIQWLAKRYPNSSIYQVGFSLGGNITLKMLGEFADELPDNLETAAAVSAPVDLGKSVDKLTQSKFFENYFIDLIRKDFKKRKETFPHLNLPEIEKGIETLRELDDKYTAPMSGFKNAHEYYSTQSSVNFLDNIKTKTLIISAKDDPIICTDSYAEIPDKENLEVVLTSNGGHVGFLGTKKGILPHFWIDKYLLNFRKG